MGQSFDLKRKFSEPGRLVEDQIQWRKVKVDGFDSPVEGPATWSDNAIQIAASKYFRRRHAGLKSTDGETSVRQLMGRVVRAITESGVRQGYFEGAKAETFKEELSFILLNQLASFNSPVYFNVGVFPEYGYAGTAESFVFDQNRAEAVSTAYVHPQASACFIQDVRDDLLSIFDLLKNEAKLFKFGSGTGTNFSQLRSRGEILNSGGESTGLISYLEIFDKAAQAIKSGGTTRRAAKMVILDADHPEIFEFIHWKLLEERKARVLLGAGYSAGMEGEAYRTVSGQNSNNSVRVTDDFLNKVKRDQPWNLRSRLTNQVVQTVAAKDLFQQMARAAWECADPGIQFHDTIQAWHMCPNSGPIRASNPCSEFMFLDNSACNLASLNLTKFIYSNGQVKSQAEHPLDWEAFRQCVRVMLLAQEILIDYASYPTAMICENSHRFRPLGLGYANLGGFFMQQGVPYESEKAEEWTVALTAGLHALSLEASCEMAKVKGAFADWEPNRSEGLKVIAKHLQSYRESARRHFTLTSLAPWIESTLENCVRQAEESGLRHAQLTLLAPTGTIGLLMDCDTLGIEPDFALLKRKTLAGGGELSLVNHSVSVALTRLGYLPGDMDEILRHLRQHGTVVGAKKLRPEHVFVFDTALAPKNHPERLISTSGHLHIMAAAQPFLSGAISKTLNLPASVRAEDIEEVYLRAWTLGLKAIAVYRDTSKAVQPLCAEC